MFGALVGVAEAITRLISRAMFGTLFSALFSVAEAMRLYQNARVPTNTPMAEQISEADQGAEEAAAAEAAEAAAAPPLPAEPAPATSVKPAPAPPAAAERSGKLAGGNALTRSWSSDWSYGWNEVGWLGKSIEQAEKANLQAKHMAIGGDGNYHALCTLEDNLYLRRRTSKAAWKKLPAPPLRGASIEQLAICSTEFDFRQFDIMDGGVSPMSLAIVLNDARLLMFSYEADTTLKPAGWKEVVYGPQDVPVTDENKLRARQLAIGNAMRSVDGYLEPLIGIVDDDGMPVVLFPMEFTDVNGGESTPFAKQLWNHTPSRKIACGRCLVMGIDDDGTLWSYGCKSLLGKMQDGQTWLDNEFKKSGIEVVDVDVYERDIVAVTATGAIHCWTRDYGMLNGIYDCVWDSELMKPVATTNYSFSTAKQFALPEGHRCVRAAMGGHELVVAISDTGDVFTFSTGLGGGAAGGGQRGCCARVGRPLPDDTPSEEEDEAARRRQKAARNACANTPTMLSRGKERGNQEGYAFHVSAVKDFFLVGWEGKSNEQREVHVV